MTLRTWPDSGLICEITDSGHWQPEEFISWSPPESAADSGFGLWGAGLLCDTVQVRTGAKGTTVRLRTCTRRMRTRAWPRPGTPLEAVRRLPCEEFFNSAHKGAGPSGAGPAGEHEVGEG
ncbi:hypothetical protein ACWD01_08080 [Streptomyces sp. NPDC002835]